MHSHKYSKITVLEQTRAIKQTGNIIQTMDNTALKIIAALAICFSLYSYLSPDSPKLYGEKQMTTHYVNKSINYATANLLIKSQIKQCDYDYYKRSEQWKNCIKQGMKRIKENTLAEIKNEDQ